MHQFGAEIACGMAMCKQGNRCQSGSVAGFTNSEPRKESDRP